MFELMAMEVRGFGGRNHHMYMCVLRIYQFIDGTRFRGVPHLQNPVYHLTIRRGASKHWSLLNFVSCSHQVSYPS